MTTAPDPKTVRKIARKFLLDDDLTADELDYVVRRHTGYGIPDGEFEAWRDAVDADVQEGTVTKVVSWPDEQPAADQDVEFRLGHGGAWCTACHRAMREGTPVTKVPAVVCEPCAADLAETGGRLDSSRLEARDTKGAL